MLKTTKCKNVTDLTETSLVKPNISKSVLANIILDLVGTLEKSQTVLKSAAVLTEELKSNHIESQNSVIKLQGEIIQSKEDQIAACKSTISSEMKSFSEVVKQGCKEKITTKQVQHAMKSAVSDDQRSKNVMIFGLKEEKNENLQCTVSGLFKKICEDENLRAIECRRVGVKGTSSTARPVKVICCSKESANVVIREAKNLKRISDYKRIFIGPDRSAEERVARRKLVDALKVKIKDEPEQYHFIQRGKIFSTERNSSSANSHEQSPRSPSREGSQSPSSWSDIYPSTNAEHYS